MALILGGILGIERSKDRQNAGMRTYMLVAIGSATAMMTGEYLFIKYGTGDPARIGAQVISGIGFLGAGSIIVSNKSMGVVKGLTTAAGLWSAACIGLAVGSGFYPAAAIGAIIVYTVMKHMRQLEYRIIIANKEFAVFMEINGDVSLMETLDEIRKCSLEIRKFQIEQTTDTSEKVTLILKNKKKRNIDEIFRELKKIEGVDLVKSLY